MSRNSQQLPLTNVQASAPERPAIVAAVRLSVWQLAWPTVLTNLLQSTVGLADVKFVGTLGTAAIAAATTGQRVFFMLQAVMMGVGTGTSALVARAWGAEQHEEASRVLRSSIGLALVWALLLSLPAVLLADHFAHWFGLDGDTRAFAASYLRWMSGFTCAFAVGLVLISALRAAGDTRTPLAAGALANVTNLVCLYLLVYGGLGFPKLGIRGAALSGGLAFSVGTALTLWLWQTGRIRLPPVAASDGKSRERARAVLRLGAPAALEQLVVQSGFIAFTLIIARGYGAEALAAYGIGVNILSVSMVIGFAFATAAATLVGQHLGAGDPVAAAKSGWRAARLAVASMSVLSVLIVWWAEPIARLMLDDDAVVHLTVSFIRILGLAQPLIALDFALGGALRGAGDTRFPLLSTLCGLVGRVLLAAVFAAQHLPVVFVYGALLADFSTKVILLAVRFRSGRWQRALDGTRC
jgi:putative MATE family efflux protein